MNITLAKLSQRSHVKRDIEWCQKLRSHVHNAVNLATQEHRDKASTFWIPNFGAIDVVRLWNVDFIFIRMLIVKNIEAQYPSRRLHVTALLVKLATIVFVAFQVLIVP